MPDFTASPLVDALEENLFSLLEKLATEVSTEALPLIDLSSGSPDQPTPPEVIDSLQSAIHRRENHGYPSFWGKPQVREAIARFYRRQYDVELDPHSEVAVFQGSHIGIGGIPRALLSPGQYLISTDPCYPIYRSAALQSQAAFYGLPLRAENHFLPDFNDLPWEVADKAGLVVLNYPHNPTGALATPARDAQGTFFLWLGVPPGYRSQEFARLLLQEAHILVAPGTGFGAGGEGFIRISLTAGDEALSNALDRLARLALF